jgi:anaerobic selenocysteine-containing dehydrogenase
MSSTIETARRAVLDLLWQPNGPLTAELLRNPGGFGLGQVPAGQVPDSTTTMVCGFCSTGCGLNIHLRDGAAINLTPSTEYPVNLGMACPKGWEAINVLEAADRATMPLLRSDGGRRERIDWDAALRIFCDRFKTIQQEHGQHSIAFLSTGQIATEEMALLGGLAKFGMGMLHGDGNTRQCMATAAVAYKQAFGFDAPPYTYADFEESDVVFLVGSNLCVAHPIMWQRVLRNPHRPEIIVVDPRRTETAMAATQHLALKPKSDLALFYGLAHILIREGWIDRNYIDAHTSGFTEFTEHLSGFAPDRVSELTGLPVDSLERTARTIHEGKRVSFWWTMGINQSYEGVRAAQSLINLALMTGNMGKPGTGANSITGQCNAMGSRLFSNTTNLLGGHDFANPEQRQKVANVLGIESSRIPSGCGWAYDQIMEGILAGKIKGLWVIATNPAHSWINQNAARDVLSRLDFLVVQDMYDSTETALMADLMLPAAAWGEKEGTFINSERRIGAIKKVHRAPGQALADFQIFRLIAQYWGCGEMFRKWTSPEAAFRILQDLSRGQPCDFTGIEGYRMVDECGGIQWPLAEQSNTQARSSPETHRRLFADGRYFHSDGRARFMYEQPGSMPEQPNSRFPLLLLTGRGSASQWHTQTRTSKSAVLRSLYPAEIYVELNPADARGRKIRSSQRVVVESQRGRLVAKALVTPTVQPGQVFIAMHYEKANQLTLAHFDPYSRQPSYKDCAVQVRACKPEDR